MADRHVGVGIDMSPGSKKALHWAVKNIVRTGDYLVLIMVTRKDLDADQSQLWEDSGSPLIPLEELGEPSVATKYGVAFDAEIVSLVESAAKEKQIQIVGKIYYGDAREKLVDAVNKLQLTALVVGSRGLGTVKRTILGSVSSYVVNNASCPVTVVKS